MMAATMTRSRVLISGDGACGVCYRGLVFLAPDNDHPTGYACLCNLGEGKVRLGLVPIAKVLTAVELSELWPGGQPAASALSTSGALAASGIPPSMFGHTLDSFRKAFGKDPKVKSYLSLCDDWLKAPNDCRSDIVMFGTNGVGKTGLAVSILHEVLVGRRGRPRFMDTRVLLARWRDAYGHDKEAERERDIVNDCVSPDVLVLDEATEGGSPEFIERVVTMIVHLRQQQRRPTVLTMNLPASAVDNFKPWLGEALGPTLYDRLRERAQFWPLFGSSRRRTLGTPNEE